MNPIWRRLGPAHISLNVWPPLTTTPTPATCSNMRVKEDPHQGRHVVATRSLQPGATVITEEPYASSLDPDYRRSYCAQCFRQKPIVNCRQGRRCGFKVRFCSSKCEQIYWSVSHRWLCHLSAMENYSHMRDALLALQIYLRYASLPLISNLPRTPPHELEMYRERALFLINAFFLDERALDALITIQGQIRCNAFGNAIIIADDTHIEKKVIGVSLYHVASMFNHDCRPNAVALFDPAQPALMRIRLTDPVKAGEPIHVSYGPLAAKNSRAERQEQLRQGYFFDCTCHSCQSEGE
ncbi:hypothetical protein BCR43DRAFT_487504 [Syncephalastrum racemosum]|uniref:Protein-lysine N-methyltransferase SMYD4 n=1 Tax=Syncephalastrum racemosum TaxID=13706 RepID=A0A1X2HR13_SYNRA|nr:hypothetical protein BCR43DRAFT_487504 [Syncephalastrum racemosum]